MTAKGESCPRHSGAVCFHRQLCHDGCVEQAYDKERENVNREIWHRRKDIKRSK